MRVRLQAGRVSVTALAATGGLEYVWRAGAAACCCLDASAGSTIARCEKVRGGKTTHQIRNLSLSSSRLTQLPRLVACVPPPPAVVPLLREAVPGAPPPPIPAFPVRAPRRAPRGLHRWSVGCVISRVWVRGGGVTTRVYIIWIQVVLQASDPRAPKERVEPVRALRTAPCARAPPDLLATASTPQ